MSKGLIDKLNSTKLAPTSLGEYAYYGKEQIILPNQLNSGISTNSSPSKTNIQSPNIDYNYVTENYVMYGYVLQ